MMRENYEYQSWREVSKEEFQARWPHFSPEEIACNGDGKLMLNFRALDMLEKLRVTINRPMILNSAYRSPAYNKKIGGATNSQHMRGVAFDCQMANQNPEEYEKAAVAIGFRGIGHYPGSNFMHVDARQSATVVRWQGTGNNARWFFTPNFRPAGLIQPVSGSPLGSQPVSLTSQQITNIAMTGKVAPDEVIDVIGEVIKTLPVNQDFNAPIPPGAVQMLKRFWPLLAPALAGPLTSLTALTGPAGYAVTAGMLIVALGGSYYVYRRGAQGPEHENA